jgi:ATP-dependent DNA helicase RecG
MLVMTATPIPRTLVMTVFGDMDVSVLREKPAGRQPIKTTKLDASRLTDVLDRLARAVAEGRRAYWVCPLVSESELVDLVAAEDRYAALRHAFGDAVRLIHGQMKPADKDAAMADFVEGRAAILVSTTVIEVGVDVPEASIMVIEHAERFGLAQLHQLRGRVGRGSARSGCLLIYKGPLSRTAEMRLETICNTEDGFVIAEKDLELRGEGELIGTRQSGLPTFRLANLDVHGPLLRDAREEAAALFAADPGLSGERSRALRTLLYLFERDSAVRLLSAG